MSWPTTAELIEEAIRVDADLYARAGLDGIVRCDFCGNEWDGYERKAIYNRRGRVFCTVACRRSWNVGKRTSVAGGGS